MVVPVLITSCHVSENMKTGPSRAQAITTPSAIPNAVVVPVNRVITLEKFSNRSASGLRRVRLVMHQMIGVEQSSGRAAARSSAPSWTIEQTVRKHGMGREANTGYARSDVTPSIPGLRYVPEYIDGTAHDRLLADVDAQPWLTSVDHRVQ